MDNFLKLLECNVVLFYALFTIAVINNVHRVTFHRIQYYLATHSTSQTP